MSGNKMLTPEQVEALRDELGRDLRVEEAAARRSRTLGGSTDSRDKASDIPSHRLPPVGRATDGVAPSPGRHTEVLEHVNPYSEASQVPANSKPGVGVAAEGFLPGASVSVRRPSIETTPVKKAKLEPLDVDMNTSEEISAEATAAPCSPHISPGEPIPSTTQEDSEHDRDVDIPELEQAASPSFASQAREIPSRPLFQELREPHLVVDLTKQDQLLPNTGADDDELSLASHAPPPAAGLLKFLNSDTSGHVNSVGAAGVSSGPNSTMRAPEQVIPGPGVNSLIHNSMQTNLQQHHPQQQQHQPLGSSYHAPQQMPPWLVDIHQGLQSLHNKADQQHREISSCLQTHGTRIMHLESVSAEHTTQQQQHEDKIKQLENRVQELRVAVQEGGSRSPRRALSAPRSPRSPRSPRFNNGDIRDEEDEPNLDIVIGGWTDARRDDAIAEARNMLEDAQIALTDVDEIWSPYSRTSFVKLRLTFDSNDPRGGGLTLSAKRHKQNRILEKLKSKRYVSGVSGSENQKLWATRSKTPEERIRTRAIVLTKEFFSNLPDVRPDKPKPFPPSSIDIVWTGKLFVGRFQVLGYLHRDGEPLPYDYLLSDSRGNHTEWYIKAAAFSGATGRKEEDLQDCWDKYGPSGKPE